MALSLIATAKRFHDEGEDARKTHFARWGARIAECPDQIAWLILDANGVERALPTALAPIRADTHRGARDRAWARTGGAGIDGERVQRRDGYRRRWNAANERRTTGLSPPKSRGAVALTAPPFVAYPLRPGVTFTHYGVAVDERLRVMKNDGQPIRNVFAAGMVMAANVLGDGYLAGLGVSLSAVFGRLAGEAGRAAGPERDYTNLAQAASSRRHAASSAGKPEPVTPRRIGKAAHQNSGAGKMVEQVRFI